MRGVWAASRPVQLQNNKTEIIIIIISLIFVCCLLVGRISFTRKEKKNERNEIKEKKPFRSVFDPQSSEFKSSLPSPPPHWLLSTAKNIYLRLQREEYQLQENNPRKAAEKSKKPKENTQKEGKARKAFPGRSKAASLEIQKRQWRRLRGSRQHRESNLRSQCSMETLLRLSGS